MEAANENAQSNAAYLRHAPRTLLDALATYGAATLPTEATRARMVARLALYAVARSN